VRVRGVFAAFLASSFRRFIVSSMMSSNFEHPGVDELPNLGQNLGVVASQVVIESNT
jgi:hypothetical protein